MPSAKSNKQLGRKLYSQYKIFIHTHFRNQHLFVNLFALLVI